MASSADAQLFKIAQLLINSGAQRIRLPGSLVCAASEETRQELKRLAKLAGVTIEVDGCR